MILSQNIHIATAVITNGKSSRIEVSNFSVDFDGTYKCIVSNDAGSVMHSFTINSMQDQSPGPGITMLKREVTSQ